jgi:hypothetical protein
MATTTTYSWVTPDDTSLVKDGASAIRTLGSSIDSSFTNKLCILNKSADQSLSNATNTSITFDTEVLDTNGFHSTSTNTDRITIPSGLDGYYQIYAKADFNVNGTGRRTVFINKNGTFQTEVEITPNSSTYPSAIAVYIMSLAVGDYVTMSAQQTSGGSLNVLGGSSRSLLIAQWIGK